jgi:23S rRNA pseudouridine1911/1915/1917 synthase
VDIYIAQTLPEFSRSLVKRWIRQGYILVEGQKTEPAREVTGGEDIQITIPPEELSVLPEPLPIEILYEDAQVLAVDKPAGQVTHPAAKNFTGTLLNAVVHYLQKKGAGLRPGIVHRLDKETSGVIIIAKDAKSLELLSRQFEKRTVEKIYRVVVCGAVESKKGEITGAIDKDISGRKMTVSPGGRFAQTDFKVLKKSGIYTYLEAYPRTGRTHQIRVHLAKIGHPVLGDPLYSKTSQEFPRMMLHAWRLEIDHPKTGQRLTLTAPLPKDFQKVLKVLG